MNRNRSKKNMAILIAALLMTAVIGMAGVFAPGFFAPAQGLVGEMATPFRELGALGAHRVEAFVQYVRGVEALEARVADLECQVDRLTLENQQARVALEENLRLRALLGLSQARPDFTFCVANVTGRDCSGWREEFTLDVGSAEGISLGMSVITGEGCLVGVVTQVYDHSARCRTLSDPNTALGAAVGSRQTLCVLEGALGEGLCRLRYLESHASVQLGDAVTTSGVGDLCPEGLLLGTVTEVKRDSAGMELEVLVEPAVAPDRLGQVFVITDFIPGE